MIPIKDNLIVYKQMINIKQLFTGSLASWVECSPMVPGRVIPKTLKMVLDTSLLNTQQYKVRIKDKVEQSRERSSALSYIPVLKLLKREPSVCPRLKSPTLLTFYLCSMAIPITLSSRLGLQNTLTASL